MSVIFTLGATAIDLPNPELGNGETRERRQARGRTHDGALLVADKEIDLRRFNLAFRFLTAAEMAALHGFFADTAKGSLNSVTYNDHDGSDHTCRFLSPELDFAEVRPGRFDVDVILEVES